MCSVALNIVLLCEQIRHKEEVMPNKKCKSKPIRQLKPEEMKRLLEEGRELRMRVAKRLEPLTHIPTELMHLRLQ